MKTTKYMSPCLTIESPFVENMNKAHRTMKFLTEWSKTSKCLRIFYRKSNRNGLYVTSRDSHQYS